MDEQAALAIFEDFLRWKQGETGRELAQMPGSTERLSKGWAF